MHESPGSNPPSDPSDVARDRADDIEQLRERLAFYESFDRLIQDNITRAGDLLREAAARKSEGELALRSSAAEFEQKQLAERVNYRRIFSSLLDEVTTVQQNVERLARQVADALDDLEAIIPAAGEAAGINGEPFPSMPSFSAGSAGELAPGQPVSAEQGDAASEPATAYQEPTVDREIRSDASAQTGELRHHEPSFEPVDELVTPDEAQYDPSAGPDISAPSPGFGAAATFTEVVQASVERVTQTMSSPEVGTETAHDIAESTGRVDESPVESAEPLPDDGLAVDLEGGSAESAAESPPDAYQAEPADVQEQWIDEGSRANTTLLVHGVPRATTALSLKRYLEGLAQVHSVEPREYAEGVLRLQVSSDRPVGLEDLRGWPDVTALEPVSVSEEFVEVRLGQ